MTKEEEITLRRFETRVRQLILQYKALLAENEQLHSVVKEMERTMERKQKEYDSLKADFANLKLAKMLEINDSDVKDAKSRLSKLIKDVDKCIALLNV